METTTPTLTVTHRSTVTEDQIDHLGHMNVRFYGVNAAAGTRALLVALGIDDPGATRLVDALGIDDPGATRLVDIYTRHHREQLLDARLVVRSGVVTATADELVLYHELANEDTDVLAATFFHRVRAYGADGAPTPFADAVRAAAEARVVTVPPHGATRSISLAADPVAVAPPLEELRRRRLAIRKVRSVTGDECAPDGSYLPTMTPMLVWAGEPLEGRFPEMLHEGPDGVRMGWASMETRIAIRRLPRLGDHVQSFSAVIGLGDKILHNIMWAWDVDREELLVTFEIVNLAFDIGARRPMAIPDAIRAAERMRVHDDLAPGAA